MEHLNSFDFDIRKTHDARFMDQKVTPDVLCIIADFVLEYTWWNKDLEFTANDIRQSDYANENIQAIFSKPDVLNKTASSEYDKFFAQPLRMLAYAQVLTLRKQWNNNFFSINRKDLLEYISYKERNALNFLILYLEKVLKDSWIYWMFWNFFLNNVKDEFDELKKNYIHFIIQNTPINTGVEVSRIFTKVLNPLCYSKHLHWTKKWFYSKDVITYDELMYNRKNWRDLEKDKWETRQEYENRSGSIYAMSDNYLSYMISKAKKEIKKRYWDISEIHDELSVWEATQVHHIFPKSSYPEIAAYLENLILLTATQHNTKAHPSNNTNVINRDYQYICLLAKSDSIKKSIEDADWFYSKDDFVYVLNIWLKPNEDFVSEFSFDDINKKIAYEYNKSL